MNYVMYLRKSQLDRDWESSMKEDTLKRHREILTEFCARNRYNVVEVYEEVVSGDSIATRPEIQKCLERVNNGDIDGVVCMDIDRLSRGSSFDSGYIMQVLQINHCKIITPAKIYDLAQDYDEQFTDLKFMFARMELKAIAKRTQRGRQASANEGKWIHKAPLGYDKFKLEGTKGYSLKPNQDADIVRQIFQMSYEGSSYRQIIYAIRKQGFSRADTWTTSSIAKFLRNQVYIGNVPHNIHKVTKRMVNGRIVKSETRNEGGTWTKGLHEGIIDEKLFWEIQEKLPKTSHVCAKYELKNVFQGILRCECCGKAISITQTKSPYNTYWIRCGNVSCERRTCYSYDKLEELALNEIRDKVLSYQESSQVIDDDSAEKEYTEKLNSLNKALNDATRQQDKICELLENGTYSLSLFEKRNKVLEEQINSINSQIANLKRPTPKVDVSLPHYENLLEMYKDMTVQEKNQFLKIFFEKIEYSRAGKGQEPVIIFHHLL